MLYYSESLMGKQFADTLGVYQILGICLVLIGCVVLVLTSIALQWAQYSNARGLAYRRKKGAPDLAGVKEEAREEDEDEDEDEGGELTWNVCTNYGLSQEKTQPIC